MEVRIGRKVNGHMDIIVPEQYNKVGKEHAKISIIDEKMTIHDIQSSNGTYVNGRKILTKGLAVEDVVFLGGKNNTDYKLDLAELMSNFKKFEFENRIDFSKEFKNLKSVYQNYHIDLARLKRKAQLKSQMPKISISLIIGVVMFLAVFLDLIPPKLQKFQYPLMLIIMTVAGFLSFSVKNTNSIDAQTELEIKYQEKYICPKCNKKYRLNMHWKKLESNTVCPHKCGAKFKN
jgi:hypothetical protein